MTTIDDKMKFVLLVIGFVATLGIAASDCINVFTIDRNNEGISGARVYLHGLNNNVGETNSSGYLLIPLDNISSKLKDTSETSDNVWNITTDKGNKWGYAMVKVPAGTCQNVTIPMLY